MDDQRPVIQLMRALTWMPLLLATLAIDVSVSLAQTPESRPGFWAGIGLGYGSANASCPECGSAPSTRGMTGSLSAGTGISNRVLAGIQIDAWYDRFDGGREILSTLTGTVRYYPSRTTRWFGIGGAGLSSYWSSRSFSYGIGWGLSAGAGYDLLTSGGWSLSPIVKLSFGMVGDLRSDGGIFLTGWKQRVVEGGMQLRWKRKRPSPVPATHESHR
jgi:hypothetical protein